MHVGTFGLPALNPSYDTTAEGGHSVLLANGNYLYEYVPNPNYSTGASDPNAGLHVFNVTPEPATWTMLLLGAAGFLLVRRRASHLVVSRPKPRNGAAHNCVAGN